MKIQVAAFRANDRKHQTGEARLFIGTIDGTQFHYVEFDKAITVTGMPPDLGSDPQVFEPAEIGIKLPEETSDVNDGKASVTMTINDPSVLRYIVTCPTAEIVLQCYRLNDLTALNFGWADGYLDMEFKGQGSTIGYKDSQVTVNCVSFFFQENRTIPGPNMQVQCNWGLYKPGCWLNKELFKITGHISAVSRLNKRIDISETAASALYTGGFFITFAGQQVGVISVEALSPSGTRLNMTHWPNGIAAGQTITLYRGCKKTRAACESFGNFANFGGTPFIPVVNPAIDGINSGQ